MTILRVVTGIRVERRLVTLPPGSTVGAAVCEDDPDDCCFEGSGGGSGSGSGGSPVTVGCCPDAIPDVLTVTVTNKTGDCSCLPDSFTITWDGLYWINNTVEGTCGPVDFALTCMDPDWVLDSTACGLGENPTVESCAPFSLTFPGLTCAGTCSGAFDLTITE